MEIYIDEKHANDIIAISKSYNVDAKIIGHVESSSSTSLTIENQGQKFSY